jgi:hypothetical protein
MDESKAPLLYTSWASFEVTEFTYSQANDMAKCGMYSKLSRIEGWTDIHERATMQFGNCIEAGVRNYYMNGIDPVQSFADEWARRKKWNLEYNKKSGDWSEMDGLGRNLMTQLLASDGKITGDDMQEHSLQGFTFNEKLTKPDWYKGTPLVYIADAYKPGEIVVDIKCLGQKFSDEDKYKGFVALDPQLRTGALVAGVRRVAFMNFIRAKTNPRIQWKEVTLTEELVTDVDLWLREQHDKLMARKFFRNAGIRFPNTTCTSCSMLPICVDNKPLVAETLRRKEGKDTEAEFASLDED